MKRLPHPVAFFVAALSLLFIDFCCSLLLKLLFLMMAFFFFVGFVAV